MNPERAMKARLKSNMLNNTIKSVKHLEKGVGHAFGAVESIGRGALSGLDATQALFKGDIIGSLKHVGQGGLHGLKALKGTVSAGFEAGKFVGRGVLATANLVRYGSIKGREGIRAGRAMKRSVDRWIVARRTARSTP